MKKMTKKQIGMFRNWWNATMTSIYDAYERPSIHKVNAYEKCLADYFTLNGSGFRICSKNTFGFTCAFLFNDDDGTTKMYYATKDNTYIFSVNINDYAW